MTDSHKSTEVSTSAGYQLAPALEGIEQLKRERAEYQHEFKRSMERLLADVARTRGEIITGQKSLFDGEVGTLGGFEAEEETSVTSTHSNCDLLSAAVTFCREQGQASVGEIARHFETSVTAAIHLIDLMDAQGLLLPAEGFAARKFKEQSA